jgi:translocation and assembly module TamA
MNRRVGQSLWAVLVLAACAGKQKPNEPPIKSVTIEGAKQVSAGDIEDHILTTGPSWWPFAPTPYFDPNAWQADMHRIERYYQARGFYQAQVVDDQVSPKDGGVALLARVQEGQPTKVSKIEFVGLGELPDDFQRRIQRRLPVRVGQILLESDWGALKAEVLSRLRELGYAEAEVGGEVLVETTNQTALVRVVCKPGLRYKFGNIFVASGPRPSVKVAYIIDQAQGAIRKDDWYSESAMAEAQRRVFKMGVFGAVKVSGGAPDRARGIIPVVIDVRESPFHTIRYGGGVGIDPVRQEYRLISEYTDRNFLGDLRKLTLKGKAGWAFIHSLWDPSGGTAPIFDLSAEFEQPRFPARNFRWISSVDAYKNLEEAYGYWGVKAKTGIVWQPHSSFSIYPSYNIEVDRITGQTNGLTGNAPSLAYGCNLAPGEDTCFVTLSYLELVVEWDKRDDKLEPRNGWYMSLGFQRGGGFLGGSFDYWRLFPDVRGYWSYRKFTLAGRLRIGTLLGADCNVDPVTGVHTPPGCNESPITARFFAGGPLSNRGFGSRRLSPLLAIPNSGALVPTDPLVAAGLGIPQVQGKTVPVGGNGLWDSSIELRYRVVGNLILAVFLDAGFVTQGSFDFGDVGPLMQYAVGIGLRYQTIVGPLRVDFAYRLNHGGPLAMVNNPLQPVRTTGGSECFGIGTGSTNYGGFPEGRCALSISIGEAY